MAIEEVRQHITVGEAASWWIKHKNKVYGALLVVVGLLGGNTDRFAEMAGNLLPDQISPQLKEDINELADKVIEIDRRVDKLEREIQTPPDDNDPPNITRPNRINQ